MKELYLRILATANDELRRGRFRKFVLFPNLCKLQHCLAISELRKLVFYLIS